MSVPPVVSFGRRVLPIVALVVILVFGLGVQPLVFAQPALSLELIFLLALTASVANLVALGFGWAAIQEAMVRRITQALPAILILFSIGTLIGSWVVSGTIPMLVYYGVKAVDPRFLYLAAFVVPAIFSTLTGTSWGSAGTIGVVILGVAHVLDANIALTAGAVVGGSYFGDKLSPLSDTTNIAALAVEIDLFDHVRSQLWTTLPATALAAVVYAVLGFVYPPAGGAADRGMVAETLRALQSSFVFSPLLLLPIVVVLWGAVRQKPTVPVLLASALLAVALAVMLQPFRAGAALETLVSGFKPAMVVGRAEPLPANVVSLLQRGGLYEIISGIVVCILVFSFVGTLELLRSLEAVTERVLEFARTRRIAIVTALFATTATNAMTSNQYATSFVVGSAFKDRFDRLGIPRRVLSRSLEDAGTLMENLFPWTSTGIYMAQALGVSPADYAPWQLLSWLNYGIALVYALTGFACFYPRAAGRAPGPARETSAASSAR